MVMTLKNVLKVYAIQMVKKMHVISRKCPSYISDCSTKYTGKKASVSLHTKYFGKWKVARECVCVCVYDTHTRKLTVTIYYAEVKTAHLHLMLHQRKRNSIKRLQIYVWTLWWTDHACWEFPHLWLTALIKTKRIWNAKKVLLAFGK